MLTPAKGIVGDNALWENGEARIVPLIGDMEEWIEMAWEDHQQNWPECPYVIQKNGKPVYAPRKAWSKACRQ